MTIEDKISKSADFAKLLREINTPLKKNLGQICTVSGTTFDTQKIILKLLEKQTRNSFIYSTHASTNCIKFLKSIKYCKTLQYDKLKELLEQNNFQRTDKVTTFSEYSIKGDTVTFWPSIYDHPLRVQFWGKEVESQEIIDEIYHNKISLIKEFAIGNEENFEDVVEKQSINISSTNSSLNEKIIVFAEHESLVNFHFTYPSLFFKRIDLLEKQISNRHDWLIKISSKNVSQLPKSLRKFLTKKTYNSGFENSKIKLAVYTDREIFGTIFIASEKAKSKKKVNKYLALLEGEINVDDYIVHEDYGIAIYKGIKQKRVLGKTMDYLILEYAQRDKLSVPITQVHKLTKFIGPDNVPPKITRLGKLTWQSIKSRVKKAVILTARELIEHYAKIELTKGEELYEHEWEDKFASEFEFRETPDQEKVIEEILSDLSNKKPMNRLLIGDVGFGKTEVAIRATFRAIMNEKQVAILCPTTILVSQHYSVFKHRLRDYPIKIATLSRFGTKKENAKIVEDLKNGKVDIVIGTHRLLSNDIKFKDLGLLVVDEEQKFGVAQKEKIKKLAYKSNVLSMSATPIPRTLSMAISNLRDISLITTPPPGRKATQVEVEHFNWNSVAQKILKEVKRGGQVYFLHNEVRTIESIKLKLEKLLPDVRFKVAHGQMHPMTLDKVMRDFYENKFDCLICTTIIENGIDIKNVNTIIINKAERFGLAQLYQLRGRVGRNTRQAFCNLFYTQKDLFKKIKPIKGEVPLEKAKARLEAILESQELGSGFKIASRDLEIRGAGNLLGREQHGNIYAIGLGLYTQMLADEIERLRKN